MGSFCLENENKSLVLIFIFYGFLCTNNMI
jgi:hypothetical protein